MSKNSSINGNKHPYQRPELWFDQTQHKAIPHFWECSRYTERAKEYYRDWINRMAKEYRKPKLEHINH